MMVAPGTDDVELFRGMREDVDGWPLVAESAPGLGARNPVDIEPDGDGLVGPGVGGVSVSPDSPEKLPRHRRPPSWGGTGLDDVWAISVSEHGEKLIFSPDPDQPETHGFIEPGEMMTLADY
jgi:hypothetical protein